MTSSTSWNDIVNKIKGVSDRGIYQTAGGLGQGNDYIAMNSIPVGYYGPSNGSWAPEVRYAKSGFGNAYTSGVLKGLTFTSSAGLKVTGTMSDFRNVIQTASTDASNQQKSCYRINNGYIEVVPAIGYWGTWNWGASCIKIPDRYNAGYNDKVSNLSVAQEQNSTATTNKNKQTSFTVSANTGKHYVIVSIMSRSNSSANVFLHTATTTNGSISQFQQLLSNSTTCVKTWHLVKSNTGATSTVTFTAGRSDAWSAFFCVKLT